MADCKRKTALLNDNPLCGISTYKDTLNLANGACTRIISKYEFTGQENWVRTNAGYFYTGNAFSDYNNTRTLYQKLSSMFSHYIATMNDVNGNSLSNGYACLYCSNGNPNNHHEVYIKDNGYSTANDFKAYLAQQYANGTPVTIWYVLEEPTTETITVPSGLSGTEEGYLNQSGTPTPTNPIYPTANNVEVWLHSLRKLTTATDSITTLPADIYADGNNATVDLVGNMSQSGTPTSASPITPSECGDRTANLLNINATNVSKGYVANSYLNASGDVVPFSGSGNNAWNISEYIKVEPNTTYYFTDGISHVSPALCEYDNQHSYISGKAFNSTDAILITTNANAAYLRVSIYSDTVRDVKPMLNTGSTAIPYQPYGYKLDIKTGSTTTPVYLGQVQSTRKIGKYVFTGQESDISINLTYSRFEVFLPNAKSNGVRLTPAFCSHYQVIDDGRAIGDVPNESLYSDVENSTRWFIKTTDYTTIPDFKAYLQQQYVNGTPVTIWYVLTTPTTGIINEPLRKIGEYADTVSGITIPTITGKDTFDVLTTLKPSEASLAYTGWHDASVKEWDGSQWQ